MDESWIRRDGNEANLIVPLDPACVPAHPEAIEDMWSRLAAAATEAANRRDTVTGESSE